MCIRDSVPVHLKSNFRQLDALCYSLKQRFPALQRSIKFEDDSLDLVADFKTSEDGPWQRVTPREARQAREAAPQSIPSSGPAVITADGISSLLGRAPMDQS